MNITAVSPIVLTRTTFHPQAYKPNARTTKSTRRRAPPALRFKGSKVRTGVFASSSSVSKMDKNVTVLPDSESVTAAMAELTANAAKDAISAKGAFSVAVAGGSLIKLLNGLREREGIEWDKWHVFWVDERCVPHSDPESNYGGAYEQLFKHVPIPSSQIYAIDESLYTTNEGASSPSAAAYDALLKGLPGSVLPVRDGLPVFDLLLLGFGPDGHICSLFPHHPLLKVTEPWVLPISDSPKPPPERITFSLPVVNAAKKKYFVAVGEGKASMLQIILEQAPQDGSIPAALVSGEVLWVLDVSAASQLKP